MDSKAEVRRIYKQFLAFVEDNTYDEDELFDLSHDLALAVLLAEFPALDGLQDGEEIDEELWMAVTSHVSGVSDKIRRGQGDERTEKMVRLTLKRARAILKRIKPRD